ncbi:hypothetical protein CXB51_012593 [Gossypium anomalum]|uniref:non-specific serine/threonine protein kinase n=1 Tax=Gossypium anomalum TaxID=47600 RepID=A0A8J5YR01_9ROSI|nr:hypothetical protein CXB51_012593 [Gossypium anomalum]
MEEQAVNRTISLKKNGSRKIIFGKLEMGRVLGQGNFAKVYYGKNISTQESVAIKVINKDQVKKEGLMEQIKREIAIMRLVRHPNVVELKEVMATKKRIFFVMEYVKGGELFAKVVKGRLKEDLARKYFHQLVSSVDFCHSRGVYHRDLKPENLLLDENDNLKVSDFGLSALPEQLRNDGLLHTQCGTPSYVAPEVLRKNGYDGAKADIWSCGVVLFVLLTGFLPFQAENVMHMYRKIFKAEYEFPPWISNDARRLISKLLVADPDKRITVPGIISNPWFWKGFSKTMSSLVEHENGDKNGIESNRELEMVTTKSSPPPFYNAFEFISSMSSGFDLSNLFENERKPASLFTSKCSASATLARLVSTAKKLKFRVLATKEFKVRMQGKVEGRKGKLAITAAVYELAPEVAVVELSKSAGDTLEYNKFYEEELRPALADIVWSWQGENNCQ